MDYSCEPYNECNDWNKRKNDLTWMLFDRGYTKDNHPEYVRWVDYKYEFEYTPEYLIKSVWEAPCGLLKKGLNSHHEMGFMGIVWRPENNNTCLRCPREKINCEHNHEFLKDTGHRGFYECAFHLSNKVYDYENSVEKINDEADAYRNQMKDKFYSKIKWANDWHHCSCINWDSQRKVWFAKYDPDECAKYCNNSTCTLTGKQLDGKRGNVFYDLKITKVRRDGTFWDGEKGVSITKGIKVFEHPVPLVICEAYAKLNKDDIFFREKMRLHHILFFNPEMEIEILNVRAEFRPSKDLLQDLQDARAGIEIHHASDLKKSLKQAKTERIKRRKEAKQRRLEEKNITKWKQFLTNESAAQAYAEENGISVDLIIDTAKKQLSKRGIKVYEPCEQLSLF